MAKFIQYKTQASLDGLLCPKYNGYLTKMTSGDLPDEGFKEYREARNVKDRVVNDEKKASFNADYIIRKPSLLIYEKVFMPFKYDTLRCDEPEILKISIATVIANIKHRGSCFLAYDFDEYLYDMIYLLKACFSIVNIYQTHIECIDFMIKQKDIDRVMLYFRYLLDSGENIYPFKKPDMNIEKLMNALFS